MDLVAAGSAIGEMARWEEKLVLHRFELALEIEGRVQTTQLTVEEVSHLVHGHVREIVDSEVFCVVNCRGAFSSSGGMSKRRLSVLRGYAACQCKPRV